MRTPKTDSAGFGFESRGAHEDVFTFEGVVTSRLAMTTVTGGCSGRLSAEVGGCRRGRSHRWRSAQKSAESISAARGQMPRQGPKPSCGAGGVSWVRVQRPGVAGSARGGSRRMPVPADYEQRRDRSASSVIEFSPMRRHQPRAMSLEAGSLTVELDRSAAERRP